MASTSAIHSARRLFYGVLPYAVVLLAMVHFCTVNGVATASDDPFTQMDFKDVTQAKESVAKAALNYSAPDTTIVKAALNYSQPDSTIDKAALNYSLPENTVAKSSTGLDDTAEAKDPSATDEVAGASLEGPSTRVVPEIVKVAAAVAGVVGTSAMGGACCGCCVQKGKSGAGCCNWCCKCCDATLDACCPCCDEKCCHKFCKPCDKSCKCCDGCCVGCPECCGCDPDCGCCRRCKACCPCCCNKHEPEHGNGHDDCHDAVCEEELHCKSPPVKPKGPANDRKDIPHGNKRDNEDKNHGLPNGYYN